MKRIKTMQSSWRIVAGVVLLFNLSAVHAEKLETLVLQVPEESPGAPWYADMSREFIPTDGEWVSIVFWRDPASVPAAFNLLDFFDIPNAFGAPLLLEGWEEWVSPPLVPGNLVRMRMENVGLVPVYFVRLDELELEIADDVLTIGELEAFSSLRIGLASPGWWPGEDWEAAKPAEAGLDPGKLGEARKYALSGGGSGLITRHGKADPAEGVCGGGEEAGEGDRAQGERKRQLAGDLGRRRASLHGLRGWIRTTVFETDR